MVEVYANRDSDPLAFFYTRLLYWSIPDEIRLLSGQNTSLSYAWYCSLDIEETQAIQVASSDVSPDPQIYLTGRSEERAGTEAVVSLFGVLPLKKVRVEIWPQMDLIPMGTAVGIDIRTRWHPGSGAGRGDGSRWYAYEPG